MLLPPPCFTVGQEVLGLHNTHTLTMMTKKLNFSLIFAFSVDLCSSFNVIFGASFEPLINALLAGSVSFGGWPSLVRFVVVIFFLCYYAFNGAKWDGQDLGYFL